MPEDKMSFELIEGDNGLCNVVGNGWTVSATKEGFVEINCGTTAVHVSAVMSVEHAEQFMVILQAAIVKAKERV